MPVQERQRNELVHKLNQLVIRLNYYAKRNQSIAKNSKTPFLKGELAKARSDSYYVSLAMVQDVQELARKALDDV